ncbi:hypothetical protein [Janthinobacterium sp. RB2P8]|uniref:hypothetical protein n=1 Tax=Janthinobacterium sp. RB2P8 TaxID=3424191 RepID=UPI003F20C0CC
MTAFLAAIYSAEKNEPADSAKFFDDEIELKILGDLVKKRECPAPGFPPPHAMRICFSVSFSTAPIII